MNEPNNELNSDLQPLSSTVNPVGPEPEKNISSENTGLNEEVVPQTEAISNDGLEMDNSLNQISEPQSIPVSNEVSEPVIDTTVSFAGQSSDISEPTNLNPVDISTSEVSTSTPVDNSINTSTMSEIPQEVNNSSALDNTQTAINGMNGIATQPSIAEQPATTEPQTDSTNIGFVAAGEPLKEKKKGSKKIAIILVALVVLGLLGYFVIYPFVMKKFIATPKNVYSATIEQLAKDINNSINDVAHEKAIVDVDLKLDSNIEQLKEFSGYDYSLRFGVDPSNELVEMGAKIKDDDTETSAYAYIKDQKTYLNLSTYEDLIYAGENEDMTESFRSFEELLGLMDKISGENLTYLVDKVSELSIESLNEDYLTQEDSSITINGNAVKVSKNTYEMNSVVIKDTVKHIIKGIAEDEKAISIIAEISDSNEDEIKDELLSAIEEDEDNEDEMDEDYVITVDLYTYGVKAELVGFAMSDTEDVKMHYYGFEGDFEFVADSEVALNGETSKSTMEVIGVKKGDKTEVTISSDDDEVATLEVRKWEDNEVDFDYVFNVEEEKFEGTFKLKTETSDNKNSYDLEFSIKYEEEYIKVEAGLGIDWKSEVANISPSSAKTLTESELQTVLYDLMSSLSTTPIYSLFSTMNGTYDNDIPEYYGSDDYSSSYGDSYYENATVDSYSTVVSPDVNF